MRQSLGLGRVSNETKVAKNSNFWSLCHNISETVEDVAVLTVNHLQEITSWLSIG